jgi:hypothetical protein
MRRILLIVTAVMLVLVLSVAVASYRRRLIAKPPAGCLCGLRDQKGRAGRHAALAHKCAETAQSDYGSRSECSPSLPCSSCTRQGGR